jgi:hypothetical protein
MDITVRSTFERLRLVRRTGVLARRTGKDVLAKIAEMPEPDKVRHSRGT